MLKTRYYFDHNSCSYKKVVLTKSIFFKQALKFLTIVLLSSFSIIKFRDKFYDSPKEAFLKKENNNLKRNYQYILDKIKSIDKLASEVENNDTMVYRAVLGANPIPKNMRENAIGGIDHYKEYRNLDQDNIILNLHKEADNLIHKLNVQLKSHHEILSLAKKRNVELERTPSIQPIENKNLKRISSGFGYRSHPTLGIRKMHYGQDFATPDGTKVYATAYGRIKKMKNCPRGGLTIVIDHGIYQTFYCHLQSFDKNISIGSFVRRGQLIGRTGHSGRDCAGSHLHYGIKKYGKYVNPINYFHKELTSSQYAEIKRLAKRNLMSMD